MEILYLFRDDLGKMTHLTMCIKESLRMHTTVPVIQRQTTRDLDIEGIKVPIGTIIDVHLYVLHHNALVWEDPEVFKPDRFTPEKLQATDNFAFVPFSAGPRFVDYSKHSFRSFTYSTGILSSIPSSLCNHILWLAIEC